MTDKTSEPTKKMPWRILISIIFARLATRPHGILMSILLVDVANSFKVPVGIMSQIRTTASIISMIFALIMGILCIKFKPKQLLMVGVAVIIVASIGCSYSPTYNIMLLFYALTGIGVAMVTPTSQTLVGEHIDVDYRPKAISYMLMSFTLVSALVSSPVINQLAVWGGWQLPFLGYVLPGAVIGLLFAYLGIPESGTDTREIDKNKSYMSVFKEILSNRSALACIACAALGTASFTSVGTYGVSSFVERFGMSPEWRAPMWSVLTFTGSVGSYLSGVFVARFGRRPVSILSALLMGLFTISFTNVNEFWLSAVLITLNGIMWTIWYPATTSLTLEQNPQLRGSIMSLNDASNNFGAALGVGIGGFILLQSDYGSLGLLLGGLGVVASVLYYFFSVDPTRRCTRAR
jgi:predicted MFS family arabinose efflux permease